MCGIAGILNHQTSGSFDKIKDQFISIQNHRGPDENGFWQNDNVLLTHNRLSIIDLNQGQQPMASSNGQIILSYNGEIYNYNQLRETLQQKGHQFTSSSDTEVLLKSYEEWQEKCVLHLEGMFAFAIWDTHRQTLFLARDHVGIKPLYYSNNSGFIAFASELNTLLQHTGVRRKIDLTSLDQYLHYQYVPNERTIYKDVKKLLPGHTLSCKLGKQPVLKKYWDIEFTPNNDKTESAWLEELDELLKHTISQQLHADVPFGAFLSGGIDSSVVSYLMSKQLPMPVETFTIGFTEQTYDERKYAEEAARIIGANYNHEVIHPNHFDFLGTFLTNLVTHYGEPFADSSAIPTFYVSQMAASKVKMILSGDGGDELFAGYNTYPNILTPNGAPLTTTQRIFKKLGLMKPHLNVIDKAMDRMDPSIMDLHSQYYAYFRDPERETLFQEPLSKIIKANQVDIMKNTFKESGAPNNLSALQYVDLKTYLPGDILTKVDVASMMHSIEVRVPLLDHKLIEFAATIPANLKFQMGPGGEIEKKYLLKKYAHQLYPKKFFDRPKQGFGVPIDSWLSGPCYQDVRKQLLNTSSMINEIINPSRIAELVASPITVKNNSAKVWALLFLNRWIEVFNPELEPRTL